jgi:hypothetical protein
MQSRNKEYFGRRLAATFETIAGDGVFIFGRVLKGLFADRIKKSSF